MPSTSWGYRAAVRIGAALAPAIGLVDRKVGDGHRRRRGAAARLSAWAAGARDTTRPLAWFHARQRGRGSAGRERAARAPAPRAAVPARLHPLQPVGRAARPAPHRGRGRLPAVRSPRGRRPAARRARPRPPRVLEARSLAGARHPGGFDRGHRGARGGHRERGQRPAPLAGAGAAPSRATRPSRRQGPSPRRTPSGSRVSACRRSGSTSSAIRASTAWPPAWPRCRPTSRCSGSDAARRRSWPAPPGRPMRRSCSRRSRGFARAGPRRVSSSCRTSLRSITSPRSTAGRRRAGLPAPVAPQHGRRPVAAAGGGPGRRARHALRGGDHGVRRRRVRAGGAALGARAGRVGRAGGVRAQLAGQPGRGAAAPGRRRRGARARGRE